MSAFDDLLADVMDDALNYAGDDFEFRSQPIRGVLSQMTVSSDPQAGGFLDTRAASLSVKASDLSRITNAADPRTLAGEKIILVRGNTRSTYRITSIVDVTSAVVDFAVSSDNQME